MFSKRNESEINVAFTKILELDNLVETLLNKNINLVIFCQI